MKNANHELRTENKKHAKFKMKNTSLSISICIARCIVRFAISKEILMDVLGAFEVISVLYCKIQG